jgi:hypothetical protein
MREINLYTRVTEVLYPFSGLKDIDPEVLKNAADRGTAVHKICDSLVLKLGKFDLEDLVKEYCRNHEHFEKEKKLVEKFVESFEKWYEGKNFLKKPDRFFNDEHMITGECDLIYKDDYNRVVLVDLKTPASESKSWLLQGSAYSYMAKKENHNIDIIEFIQLSRTGAKPKCYRYKEQFELFKSHLDSYRYSFKNSVKEDLMDYL